MKQSTSFNINSQFVRASITALTTFGLSCGLAQVSSAATISGFTGLYALNNWSRNSTTATSTLTPNSPTSVTIRHSNNGVAPDGQTNFTIIPSSLPATWSFNWALDGLGNQLTNVAVYLVRNSVIASTIFSGIGVSSGSSSFNFSNNFTSGDSFGFRFATTNYDAAIKPIDFQIKDFSVQQNEPVATPFEFSPTLGLGLLGAWVGYRRWQRRSKI